MINHTSQWAYDIGQILIKAQELATEHGDYDSARLLQTEAIARGFLAVADAINQLALRTNQEHEHTYRLGDPTCVHCGAQQVEQIPEPTTEAEWAAEIERLAADLWKADPANRNSPARRFTDDYLHRQDTYRAMARAALGIQDEPTKKDNRRP